MYCMKCGRETQADAVFCEECLEHMDRHPVPPNTLVYVPSEKDRVTANKHIVATPVVTPEEQVKRLTKRNRALTLLVILLIVALVFLTLLSLDAIHEMDVASFIGKNYTAITSSATLK